MDKYGTYTLIPICINYALKHSCLNDVPKQRALKYGYIIVLVVANLWTAASYSCLMACHGQYLRTYLAAC